MMEAMAGGGIRFRHLWQQVYQKCMSGIVLASRVSWHHLDTQILKNQMLWSPLKIGRPKNYQCLSQDLETGCLKLAVVQFLGVQIFKRDHNILIFQP